MLLTVLCGCEKSEIAMPKIIYTEKEAFYPSYFSDESVSAQDSLVTAIKTELKIMDDGYRADAVAAIENNVLAADLDSRNFEAVLCRCDFDESGTAAVSERKIVFRSDTSADEYLYSITAGQDGYFYLLSGEAPRMSMKKSADGEYTIAENAEYSGKYEILKLDTDGNIVSSVPVNALPADSVCNIRAVSEDRLYISAAMCIEDKNLVFLDNFVLYEFSMTDGIIRSMNFEQGDVPTDVLLAAEGNYIAVKNGERVKLHEFDVENFCIGSAVPTIAYRDFAGSSSTYNGAIILPSGLDFCVYNIGENTLTPIISRTDGDIGWFVNCTVILFDERTVICTEHGSEFLTVYYQP